MALICLGFCRHGLDRPNRQLCIGWNVYARGDGAVAYSNAYGSPRESAADGDTNAKANADVSSCGYGGALSHGNGNKHG